MKNFKNNYSQSINGSKGLENKKLTVQIWPRRNCLKE